MKYQILTILAISLINPLFLSSQEHCFDEAGIFWELAPGNFFDNPPFTNLTGTMDEGVACALELIGQGCDAITSEETLVEFTVYDQTIDLCDIYCQTGEHGHHFL